MSDDNSPILINIAKQLGALDSKLDATHQDLREHKQQYNANAVAARDHATLMAQELAYKMDKRDYATLVTANNVVKAWPAIAILLAIAIAFGILKWGEGAKEVLQTKENIESKLKGKAK